MKRNGTSELTKLEALVATWKITSLSAPRHFKPLSFCWRHYLHHSTASSFAEGQQQHLLARRLINWLIRRPRCKLIDWSSCGGSCLYLEPRGAKLWRSPVICHVQHTGGRRKERRRAVGSLPRHGGHVWRKTQPRWEQGACRENNGNMGTKVLRMKAREKICRSS